MLLRLRRARVISIVCEDLCAFHSAIMPGGFSTAAGIDRVFWTIGDASHTGLASVFDDWVCGFLIRGCDIADRA